MRCAASHCARVKPNGSVPAGGPPVFAMYTSIGPSTASTSAITPGTASRSSESKTTPCPPTRSAASRTRAASRDATATRAPSAAKSRGDPEPDPPRATCDERHLPAEAEVHAAQ